MSGLRHSLYARIACVYLLLLLCLSALVIWATLAESRRFSREVEQRQHMDLAGDLAIILKPALGRDLHSIALRKLTAQIRAINPTVDLYLLDRHGNVIRALNQANCRSGAHVPLAPIRALLSRHANLPLTAPDPCGGGHSIFSAAPIGLADGQAGYLFVTLRGHPYHSGLALLKESHSLRSLIVLGGIIIALAGVVGLIGFAFLTRRLRALTASVDAFKGGNYAARVPERDDDEITELSRAFNSMAATIEAQVAALREADELRRDQVANISHDFRTPLTSLRVYAEKLSKRAGSVAGQYGAEVRAILDNVEQLEHLADQLSMMSRLDSPHAYFKMEPFSLSELVQDVLVKFRPRAEAAGVDLSTDPLSPLPLVVGDIGLIERVFVNLIDNAFRNTPSGGAVYVSLTPTGDHVCVEITDTGCGISPEELPLVTQRFYRVRADGAAPRKGSGLGLAIAREAVALHGGELRLRSRVGAGTTVTFNLPVQQRTR
ncbi:MAG TPA: HAMP domain-containing sensor histidine kinase [Gammaproteobacteria bacterium]|nr:HAMP domain-containing sensor histidine kinase [Gammaproteobacteria bacterium]